MGHGFNLTSAARHSSAMLPQIRKRCNSSVLQQAVLDFDILKSSLNAVDLSAIWTWVAGARFNDALANLFFGVNVLTMVCAWMLPWCVFSVLTTQSLFVCPVPVRLLFLLAVVQLWAFALLRSSLGQMYFQWVSMLGMQKKNEDRDVLRVRDQLCRPATPGLMQPHHPSLLWWARMH